MKKLTSLGALLWCCSIVMAQSKPQDMLAELLYSLPQPPQENIVLMMAMPGMAPMPMPPKQQLMSFSGSGSSTFSFTTHFGTCSSQTGGGNVNCFNTAIPSTLVSVFSDNGVTYGIDSNHNGYVYNDWASSSPNTWTYHSEWGSVYVLHQGSDGKLYGMYGSCFNGAGHLVGVWTGTAWQDSDSCFTNFVVSPNSSALFLAIDLNGALWESTTFGTLGFTQVAVPTGKWLISATVIGAPTYQWMVVTGDNEIYYWNGSSYVQPTNGTCCAKQIAADGEGNWYVTGTDGNLYHYNGNGFDGPMVGPGTLTSLANGGNMYVFAVGPTNNSKNVYRFNTLALVHNRNFGGTVSCIQGNNPLCTNATHTVYLKVALGSIWGQQNQAMCDGPCSTSAVASVQQDDLFSCFQDASSNCTPATSGSFNCSVAGDLGNDFGSWSWPKLEMAQARGYVTAVANSFQGEKMYTIQNECVTSDPDMVFGGGVPPYVQIAPPPPPSQWAAFDVNAFCFSFNGHQPFWCEQLTAFGPEGVLKKYTTDPGLWDECSSNP